MYIHIDTEPLPPEFHWDPKEPRRGTEEFYVRTAECLSELGHTVDVYYDGEGTRHNGVKYRNREGPRINNFDAIIVCNQEQKPGPPGRGVSTQCAIYWTNRFGDRFDMLRA